MQNVRSDRCKQNFEKQLIYPKAVSLAVTINTPTDLEI